MAQRDISDLIFRNSQAAIAVSDEASMITRVNPAFERVFGYTSAEAVGRNIDELITPGEKLKQALAIRDKIVHSCSVVHSSAIRQRKDGRMVYVSVLVSAIMEDGKRLGALAVYRDLTEQIQDEAREYSRELDQLVKSQTKALQQAQETIAQSQVQNEMAVVASSTLHNVKNILNGVRVSSQMIAGIFNHRAVSGFRRAHQMLKENIDRIDDFVANDPKGKTLMRYFVGIGDLMEKIFDDSRVHVSDLTAKIQMIEEIVTAQQSYGRDRGLDKEDLGQIIADALTIQSASFLNQHIQIRNEYHGTFIVLAHRTKLIHILINLIKNAQEAMVNNETRTLIINLQESGDWIELNMTDNGHGIHPDHMSRLFRFGFTTKEDGHGFGLHSCAVYMQEMNGELTVKSKGPNQGATFTLRFPKIN